MEFEALVHAFEKQSTLFSNHALRGLQSVVDYEDDQPFPTRVRVSFPDMPSNISRGKQPRKKIPNFEPTKLETIKDEE